MKLTLLKPVGLLKVGETHITRTDEQGQYLIDNGYAELHPDQTDVVIVETKNQLYKDSFGNWRTSVVPVDYDGDGSDLAEQAEEEDAAYTAQAIAEPLKPKAGRKPKQ